MKFHEFSFQKKLFISCILLNSLLLVGFSLFFYYYSANSLRENMRSTLSGSTSMIQNNLDTILNDADNTLKELQLNTALLDTARNIPESENNYLPTHIAARSAFQDRFRTTLMSSDLDVSLNYVSKYYDHLGISSPNGTSYTKKAVLENNPNLTGVMDSINYVLYVPPHKDYWKNNRTVISVVRSMRDIYHQYGLLIADFDMDTLTKRLLSGFDTPEDYDITILDDADNLVYTSSSILNRRIFLASWRSASKISPESGSFSYGNLSVSSYHLSDKTGWTVILSENSSIFAASIKRLLIISTLLFVIMFIIMSTFLMVLTRNLTQPLRQLTDKLTVLDPGENISAIPENSDNEIIFLTNAIQGYLSEIYDQNQRLTEQRKRTLIAHYDAMEAQLNPHFLYNTLSVIGMTGLASGNMDVSNMCTELSQLLRYSLSYTGQSVILSQEIDNARHYLYIMKIRYEDDLEYEWQLDDSLNSITVPKLILQPLIENCFQHGFHQAGVEISPPWKISIRSHCDDTRWYLSISNNGAPFPEEKLAALHQKLSGFTFTGNQDMDYENTFRHQGYGLENTILRFHIYYRGEEYFHVSRNDSDNLTTVTIGGPLKPEKLFSRSTS